MARTPKRGHVGGGAAKVYPYEIQQSAFFPGVNGVSYLERTIAASSADRTKATFSCWVRPNQAATSNFPWLFGAGPTSAVMNPRFGIWLGRDTVTTYGLMIYEANSAGTVRVDYRVDNSKLFADPAGWYHIFVVINSNEAISADRIKAYINGAQVSLIVHKAVPSGHEILWGDCTQPHLFAGVLAATATSAISHPNSYYAEVVHIDGQVRTPDDFGQWSKLIPSLWVPKQYVGTYGRNGFHLDFANGAALGNDVSGNGNHFSAQGAPYQLLDTPTNTHCVWNNLVYEWNTGKGVYTNGNRTASTSADQSFSMSRGTGLYSAVEGVYWELALDSLVDNTNYYYGLCAYDAPYGNMIAEDGYFTCSATGYWKGTVLTNWAANPNLKTGDVIQFAAKDNKMWVGKNGAWLEGGNPENGTNPLMTDLPDWIVPFVTPYKTNEITTLHSGATGFTYTPPSGFKTLCTANLPEPEILNPATGNDIALYQGNGTTLDISGLNMAPDYANIKDCSASAHWLMCDTVRGATKALATSYSGAESTEATSITAFNSDGISLGNYSRVNNSGANFLAQFLKRGPAFGFDIVPYNGAGLAGLQIAHNCGGAPELIIVKCTSGSQNWGVYHVAAGATKYGLLNDTRAFNLSSSLWNDTEPTATHFTVGDWTGVNQDGQQYVAYIFRSVPGFSKVFSYEGNGNADGPYTDLGFRPKAIMLKDSAAAVPWYFFNTEVNPINPVEDYLYPNAENAEQTAAGLLTCTSTGFKVSRVSGGINTNGDTIIGIAWAEQPFKYSNAF